MTAVMVGHLVVEEVGGWLGNTGNPQMEPEITRLDFLVGRSVYLL
jgi:hypothetical protein